MCCAGTPRLSTAFACCNCSTATMPLMSMLRQGFPQALMTVCGVRRPKSKAQGPNELLHVPDAQRLTAAVALLIATHP
jgi:hypothetical protein